MLASTETLMTTSNVARELQEFCKETKLPISVIAPYGLHVTTTAFYLWCDAKSAIPPERRQQMIDLLNELRRLKALGILPMDRSRLMWEGLKYVAEVKPLEQNS